MPTKTTGAEFKRFYNDESFWPNDDGATFHDEGVITIDGVVYEYGLDPDNDPIPDDAEVIIEGGTVYGPNWDGDEPSLETYFKRWKKKQNTASFLVECDQSVLDAVKAAIKAAGGRVSK